MLELATKESLIHKINLDTRSTNCYWRVPHLHLKSPRKSLLFFIGFPKMSQRLSEIKNLLSNISSKDIKSLELYKEALLILLKSGKIDAVNKCKEQIRRLELNFEKTCKSRDSTSEALTSQEKENSKSAGGSEARKQLSILNWTVKANSPPSASSLSDSLTILTGKNMLKNRTVYQTSKWHELPMELIGMVAQYLSPFDIYRLSLSCANLKSRLQSNSNLWRCFDWSQFAKRLRNEHLEMLYSMTRGECKSFILKDANGITSSFFHKISKGKLPVKKLEELYVQSNSKLTGAALVSFLSQKSLINTLTKVSLISIRDLDDKSVSTLLTQLENVKEWNFSNCYNLTDASISKIQRKVTDLVLLLNNRNVVFKRRIDHYKTLFIL